MSCRKRDLDDKTCPLRPPRDVRCGKTMHARLDRTRKRWLMRERRRCCDEKHRLRSFARMTFRHAQHDAISRTCIFGVAVFVHTIPVHYELRTTEYTSFTEKMSRGCMQLRRAFGSMLTASSFASLRDGTHVKEVRDSDIRNLPPENLGMPSRFNSKHSMKV